MNEHDDGDDRVAEAGPAGVESGHGMEAARIEQLERAVRRLWLALAAVVLAGATLALALAGGSERLEAREIALSDADGRTRIALSAAKDGGTLEHYDGEGRLRLSQGIDAEGRASVTLLDPQGGRRIAAAAFADGDAGLALLDPAGKVRIQLISESEGLIGTLHLDPQGRKRIETLAAADGTAVQSFIDPSGKVRLQLGTRATGLPVFSLENRGEGEEEAGPSEAEERPAE
jgi:hypothetical protein